MSTYYTELLNLNVKLHSSASLDNSYNFGEVFILNPFRKY